MDTTNQPLASAPVHWSSQYKRPPRRPVVVVAMSQSPALASASAPIVPSFTDADLYRMTWGRLAGAGPSDPVCSTDPATLLSV